MPYLDSEVIEYVMRQAMSVPLAPACSARVPLLECPLDLSCMVHGHWYA
jgi:hypothetical protein